MPPKTTEPVCLISFEVTRTRLGGDPDERPSFWKVYREELALNVRTSYNNTHVEICRPVLFPLREKLSIPHYYREGRLVTEKEIATPSSVSP